MESRPFGLGNFCLNQKFWTAPQILKMPRKLTASTSHLGPIACPDGWFLNGSSCYESSKLVEPWDVARQKCTASNSSMVKIDDEYERRFLAVYMDVTGLKETKNVSENDFADKYQSVEACKK